jgi:hypothetical protein
MSWVLVGLLAVLGVVVSGSLEVNTVYGPVIGSASSIGLSWKGTWH